jgi:uncharacterized repeat protein (TIGR01451 family)
MKHILFRVVTAVLLLSAWAGAQISPAQGPVVELMIEMYLVENVDGSERLTPSLTARRGQVVEYRIFAVNRSDTQLQAGTVEVSCPVPDGVSFQEHTATPNSEQVLIEYSVDGVEFSLPPLVVERDGTRVVIEPADYRAVRWTLLEEMEPGQEEVFTFRVTVD